MKTVEYKYTGLLYGEGRKEKNFLNTLISVEKFLFHTSNWRFNCENASGGTASQIMLKCKNLISQRSYDFVMCFIDLDRLKIDYPKNWKDKKSDLEKKYQSEIVKIIWQEDNLEQELMRVIRMDLGKHGINKAAKKNINEFVNSPYWNKIIEPIKLREKEIS